MAYKVIVLIRSSLPIQGIRKFQSLLENYNIVNFFHLFCSAILIMLVFVFEMVEAAPNIKSSDWNMQQQNTNTFLALLFKGKKNSFSKLSTDFLLFCIVSHAHSYSSTDNDIKLPWLILSVSYSSEIQSILTPKQNWRSKKKERFVAKSIFCRYTLTLKKLFLSFWVEGSVRGKRSFGKENLIQLFNFFFFFKVFFTYHNLPKSLGIQR